MSLLGYPSVRNINNVAQCLGQLIGLKNGQRTKESAQGKKNRQGFPFATQSLANHIHGSALDMAFGIFAPVHNRKGAGKEFGGDPDKSADPHPKDGAGPAHSNGNSHSADISQPDSGGEGTRKSLEMINVTGIVRVVILAPENIKRVPEIPKGSKARIDHKKESAATEQENKRESPHDT